MHASKPFLILVLSLLPTMAVPTGGSGVDDPIDGSVSGTEAMARLRNGEILVENIRTGEPGGAARVQALMHSDLQELWGYIASCDSVFKYVKGLRQCELLGVEHGLNSDTTKLRQVVKKSWVIPGIDYIIEVRRQPPNRIDFKLIEGNLKALEGGWRFNVLPDEQGIVVTHEVRVQPDFPAPRWLIRRSMRKDVPDMLACLRGLTHGSGDFPRSEDLKRCPRKQRRKQ